MRYFFKPFLFVVFSVFCCFGLWATDVSVAVSKGTGSSSFSASFSKKTRYGTASWSAKISQNNSGLFTIKPSDFISFRTDFAIDGIKASAGAGEIKFDSSGIRNLTKSSLSPSYSGFWFRSRQFDLAVLNPLLEIQSPQGVISFVKLKNFTFGAGFYSYSNKSATEEVTTWQTDYSSVKAAGAEGYLSINTGCDGGTIELSAKLNSLKGLTSTEKLIFSYGGFSYDLKLDGTFERQTSFTKNDGPYSFIVSFYDCKGTKPVYGGTSQKAKFRLTSDLAWNDIHFVSTSIKNYNEDTGSESYTKAGISIEGSYCGKKYSTSVTAVLRRTSGSTISFLLPELIFKTKGLSFSFKDNKGTLEFRKTFKINKAGVVISFNQNRLLKISTGFAI